jgi:hypothetical protein
MRKHNSRAIVIRNSAARSALLRKGGAHGKTRKAERREAKVALGKSEGDGQPAA